MARFEQLTSSQLTLVGSTDFGTTVLQKDASGNSLLARGASVPSAVAGFAIGGQFEHTSTGALYLNTGTAASCTFTLTGTVAGNSVTLAMLTAGITPSHVVKYAGKVTWTGSGASKAATIAGVVSTDVVVASIQTVPTQAAYLVSAAPTTDTVTFVLSAANTSNDAVISYQVLRAAA